MFNAKLSFGPGKICFYGYQNDVINAKTENPNDLKFLHLAKNKAEVPTSWLRQCLFDANVKIAKQRKRREIYFSFWLCFGHDVNYLMKLEFWMQSYSMAHHH